MGRRPESYTMLHVQLGSKASYFPGFSCLVGMLGLGYQSRASYVLRVMILAPPSPTLKGRCKRSVPWGFQV